MVARQLRWLRCFSSFLQVGATAAEDYFWALQQPGQSPGVFEEAAGKEDRWPLLKRRRIRIHAHYRHVLVLQRGESM